jgi:exosortase
LLVAGWRFFWQLRWILVFLFLMVPFPGRVHNAISGPLQDYATTGAVFVLELLGSAVAREGHVMVLDGGTLVAVAEACSGLRMLTAFIVVGSVLAYVVNRPRWQKVVLLASTVPIAILCNLVRLVITAELYAHVGSELAQKFFHDFAGLTMMPMAVLVLVGELWLMAALVVPEEAPAAGTRA